MSKTLASQKEKQTYTELKDSFKGNDDFQSF